MRRSGCLHRTTLVAGVVAGAVLGGAAGAWGATAPPITEFPVPTAGSFPAGITAGPDGNLWFTENSGNKIGRITPAVYAAVAVYRTTTGEWFIRRSSDAGLTLVAWGPPGLGDVPVPARY